MVRRNTTSRRGKKATSHSLDDKPKSTIPSSPISSTNETTLKKKDKASFKGHLSHKSPISMDKKITAYFTVNKQETVPIVNNEVEIEIVEEILTCKSLALQRVFGRNKERAGIKSKTESPPHKIQIKVVASSNGVDTIPSLVTEEESTKEPNEEPKIKPSKAKRRLIVNQSLNQDASQNHKLTEYFAVRRSVRKPKTALLEEKQRSLEEAVLSQKEDGLEIHNFPGKGRGIVTTRLFRKGEFVVEYYGDLIDLTEAKEREVRYAADQNTGCYMYYFQHKNQPYCVDATAESGRLGRLVNHSRNGNLIPKIVEIKDRPHLVLVARIDIPPGAELLYDYGDRSRLSLKHHPWLAL